MQGSLQKLVDTIEDGKTVQMNFPTRDEAIRFVNNVRCKLYRERQKLTSIMDADFEPFSFAIKQPDFIDTHDYVLILKLSNKSKSMYEWKVVE